MTLNTSTASFEEETKAESEDKDASTKRQDLAVQTLFTVQLKRICNSNILIINMRDVI